MAYWVSNQLLPEERQAERETPALSLAREASNMMIAIRRHNQLCHPSNLAQLSADEIDRQLEDANALFGEARGHFAQMELAAGRISGRNDGLDLALNQLLGSVEQRLATYGTVAVTQANLIEGQLNPPEPAIRLAPSVYLAAVYEGFQQRREALKDMQGAYSDLLTWLEDPCHHAQDCHMAVAGPPGQNQPSHSPSK
ncbi:MAG: hypothetical protein KI792_05770 [Alphaproteobacteria bacterium]|nr:hypothetical protein [Alphaproteobacteria bacterium SS10]